jgi:hypothetical protein
MENKRWVAARETEGVQHCHGDECDEYWYRPLVYSKHLFTYIPNIPPGGGVPPSDDEAKLFELSLYVLAGDVRVQYGDETFTLTPHHALHIPKGVPVGFENRGQTPVTILLSFAPPPGSVHNTDEMRQRVEAGGRRMWSPAELNAMAGDLFDA